jgi:light-regulated signal transduction histidine kinase (bacteriophytochrome)
VDALVVGAGLDREYSLQREVLRSSPPDQLFSAFFTTKPGDMGMGLSISCSIIEAHGGRLWASPDTPHSAIFHFVLPVERSRLPGDLAPGSRRRSS